MFKGDYMDVPILLGHTNNEFPMRPPVNSMDELKAFAKGMFGDDADTFLQMIKVEEGLDEALKNATVNGIEYSVRLACRNMDKLGMKGPHYYFIFGPEIPGWDNPGAFHSSDLWFWFETFSKCWRAFNGKHYDLARQMCNYWANFIRSGDPNGNDADGKPMEKWEAYTDAHSACMTLYEAPKAEVIPASEFMELLMKAKADYKE
jgi:para-nitrobenzyl esterase